MDYTIKSSIIRREFVTPRQALATMLRAWELCAMMQMMLQRHHPAWEDAQRIEAPQGTQYAEIHKTDETGYHQVNHVVLRSESYLTIKNNAHSPWSGHYHMVWGYCELTHAIIYWVQQLIEVKRGDKPYAITETGEPGRISLSNPQIGRRDRSPSESN